jgi:hypothetical protein
MTQDEIIEMARQSGAYRRDIGGSIEFLEVFILERFAKLVSEREREACAAMSDWILKEGGGTWGDAIRARGQE